MKKTKFKPMILSYDWKDNPGYVVADLAPLLKKFGIYILNDPFCIGSDTAGYIVTDNHRLTIGEYKKLMRRECGDDLDEWFDEEMKVHGLTDKDSVKKWIERYFNENHYSAVQ